MNRRQWITSRSDSVLTDIINGLDMAVSSAKELYREDPNANRSMLQVIAKLRKDRKRVQAEIDRRKNRG